MNRWVRFSGIFGLVLFAFGFLGTMLMRRWPPETILLIHIALGLGLIFFWFLTSGIKGLKNAGGVIKGRTTRFTTNVLLYTLVMLGLIGGINWLAKKYDKRWDLTAENVYSLADQSDQAIKKLSHPLKIVGFKRLDGSEDLKNLLTLYKNANPSEVTTEFVDPQAKPHLIDRYQMKAGNLVYLEYGEKENTSVSRLNETTEESITNAIIKLTRGIAKKIYYIQGHGEPNLTGSGKEDLGIFAKSVGDEHLTIEGLLLAQKGSIPEDAAAVMLVSPKSPMLPEEKDILIKYAESGGRLVLLTDPRTTSDVKDIAAKFDIKVHDDVIVDQVQRLFAGPALGVQPLIREYGTHPITKNFTPENIVLFNMASSVEPVGTGSVNNIISLVKTGSQAWGETNLADLLDSDKPTASRDEGDNFGPLTVGAAYEKKLSNVSNDPNKKDETSDEFKKSIRVAVYGNSDWILNGFIGAVGGNRDLILNTLNWVVGEDGGITIRPRSIKESAAPMTIETFLNLLAASFILPELILLLGLFIWWNRRTVSVS